jgi:NADPH-dependent curcumin reductase CurA
MNKTIILESRPVGKPKLSDFKTINDEKPQLETGEILLKSSYISVDPYLRGRMSDAKSYAVPFQLHQPISSLTLAEVVESNHKGFSKGDFVSGLLQWKEYQKSDGVGLQKVDPSKAPLSAYLGILGMTGLTAYLGLTEIGKPMKCETMVVSGAAGAVGSIVGQIGKILGCRVIGIAGTDEKVELLKSKYGFDAGINYNTTSDLKESISVVCPEGVDIYFDNVGGNITDGVLANINKFSRLIICGSISMYNETAIPVGPRVEMLLIKTSALMQGFIIGNYASKFPEAMLQLSTWLKEGKLTYSETIVEGFDQLPQAFMDLFDGKNIGKMIVKI